MRRSARWALGILGELLSEHESRGGATPRPPLTTASSRAALVTGGTGGIGEEVCRGLAARGSPAISSSPVRIKGKPSQKAARGVSGCTQVRRLRPESRRRGAAEGRQPAGGR